MKISFRIKIRLCICFFTMVKMFGMEQPAQITQINQSTLQSVAIAHLKKLINQLHEKISTKEKLTDANIQNFESLLKKDLSQTNCEKIFYLQNLLNLKKSLLLILQEALVKTKLYISKTYPIFLINRAAHIDVIMEFKDQVLKFIDCKQNSNGSIITYSDNSTQELPNTYLLTSLDGLAAILQSHHFWIKGHGFNFRAKGASNLIKQFKKSKIREVLDYIQWLDSEKYYELEMQPLYKKMGNLLVGIAQSINTTSNKIEEQILIENAIENRDEELAADIILNGEYITKLLSNWSAQKNLQEIIKKYFPELFTSIIIYNLIFKEFLQFDDKKNSREHLNVLCQIIEQTISSLKDVHTYDSTLYALLSKKMELHKPKKINDYRIFAQKFKQFIFALDHENKKLSSLEEKIRFQLPNTTEFAKFTDDAQINVLKNKKKKATRSPKARNRKKCVVKKNKKRRSQAHSKNEKCITKQIKQKEVTKDQELNKLKYDPRIIRWFNLNFASNQQQSSVLYHTFTPAVDSLLIENGIAQKYPNKNHKKMDTRYYMAGIIKWPNGDKKRVIFCICKDSDGIIYHRGFQDRANCDLLFEEFEKNEFEYDFPALSQEEADQTESMTYNFIEEKNSGYKETEFCFYIEDPKNKITIVLFKTFKET